MLRLVTWNIQWGRGCDGRVDLGRIVSVLRSRGEPDVVLLQEVADGFADLAGHDGGDQFAALAGLLPGWTVIAAPATEWHRAGDRPERFGNLLATRLPVGPVWRHLLPWPAAPGVASMQRVALEATLHAPFGPLRVTTTHLEYYAPAQRLAQVQRLRELHLEAVQQAACARRDAQGAFRVRPRGRAGVLCGDLNDVPGSPALQALLAPFDDGTPGYVDAWLRLHPGRPHPMTVGVHDRVQWPDGPRSFDHFLVTEDLAGRLLAMEVDAATDHSDHQPVWLQLDDTAGSGAP